MNSIVFGLLSAITWGGGDFAGGLASRKLGAYRAVFLAEGIGLIFLFLALFLFPEPIPAIHGLLMAASAGVIGSIGLMILYHAMAHGKMSIAAPVSALLAAALPVVVGIFTQGVPKITQVAGFVVAFAAIWLVSSDGSERSAQARWSDIWLPLLAGAGFGSYFILLHMAAQEATIWPMIASRTSGLVMMGFILLARRELWQVSGAGWPLVILNAGLDVGGNAFYVFGSQAGRLDIAAVLSSLYPGTTALLAWFFLKERIGNTQKLGIATALAAIALMTISQ